MFFRRLTDRVRFVYAVRVAESALAPVGGAVGEGAVGVRVGLRYIART